MSDCCSASPERETPRATARKAACPSCGASAASVPPVTLWHNLHAPANRSVRDVPHYFCAAPGCEIVYFSAEGDRYTRAQVRMLGYEKTGNLADLVCHCFDVTGQQVADEYRTGGRGSREFIVEQTRQQRCACDARNPSGRCCLKAIGTIEAGLETDPVTAGLHRLQDLLPLAERLDAASPQAPEVYGQVRDRLLMTGRAVEADDLPAVDAAAFHQGITELAAADLVVADAGHSRVLGVYPVTTEATDHRLDIDGVQLFAMCAVDALAVAPVTGDKVQIDSRCAVSGEAVRIRQAGEALESAEPAGVQVGIAWQDTGGCAAHSLCRDMVFLADPRIAADWHAAGAGMRSIYTLHEALALGRAFFMPLSKHSRGGS